jgi:hypothetical protein
VREKASVLAKTEIVAALVREGFMEHEASRAYELMLDELERALRAGRTLLFRRLFKIWPERMPPRRHWDNWNKKYIYFGERLQLKVKAFYLKDRNLPTGRKIRAGRRAPLENELPPEPNNSSKKPPNKVNHVPRKDKDEQRILSPD